MNIVFKLSSLFNLTTLVAFIAFLLPRVLVIEDRGEIVSVVPIRAVYGKGFCWVAASQPYSLPVRFNKPVYNIFVSNKSIIIETYLGRTKIQR